MEPITLAQLLEAVHGRLLGSFDRLDTPISKVETDSRSIHPGTLFLPLVGERFDGHAYINSALEGGAAGCITALERDSCLPGKFYVKVEDTQQALRDLAVWHKNRFAIPLIGVTGSVGKTTAKDMLAAVLGVRYKVLKTEGNHNNNIGLPLTLLELNSSHQIAVLEMGMDKFGEIDYLAGIVKPDVGIITNIGDAHIERLGSRENIFRAKCELLPHVKGDGLLILNGDDPLLASLKGNVPVPAVFCGQGEGCDYRAQVTGGDGVSHIHCRLTTPHMDRDVRIPALGEHMIYPALIAAAAGERFGLTPDQIEEGLSQFVPTRMRMKVAVLGDMLELGPFAPALHSGVGEYLGTAGVDCLVAVGSLARHIAEGAREAGVAQVIHCHTREDAMAVLPQVVGPDCTVLVKASRGMKLEELTARLLALTEEV